MSGSGYDPFDVTHTDQPYDEARGGLNPDFARNLLAFGAAAMQGANARTAGGFLANGTGPLGGIGAGIQGAMQQNLAAGRTRSELGYQNAQTQGQLLENQIKGMSIPYQKQLMELRTRMMSDPSFMQQYMQTIMGDQQVGSATPTGQPGAGGIALGMRQNNPGNLEFAGQPGAAPGQGNRFATFPDMASGIAASANQLAINQEQHGVNTVRGQVTRWVSDPKADLTSYISDTAKALGVNPDTPLDWTNPSAQAKFLLAQQPHESGGGGAVLNPADVQRGVQMAALQRGQQTQRQAPYQVATAGAIPPPPSGASPSAPGAPAPMQTAQAMPAARPGAGAVSAAPAGPDPHAMATSEQYLKRADAIEFMRSVGVPAPGDPAGLRQAAQSWREYAFSGAKAGAEAAGKLPFVGPTAAAEANAQVPAKLAAEGFMPTPDGSGVTYIPGGKQDPNLIRQQEVGKAQGQNVELRTNSMVLLANPDGSRTMVKNPALEKVTMPDGSKRYAHISPPPPNAPPGTPGETSYVVDDSGKFMNADQAPLQQAFQHTRGEHLAEQQDKIDSEANAAKESNYLFDNMRHDSQTWDMGKFANFEGEARAYVSAIAQVAGIKTPGLNEKLADYQAFNKSSGSLLRTAVHDTSSKAAAQEYTMIGQTLPTPTTSQQGFGQIADQWQGLSDYKLAKQQYARGYLGKPEDLNVDFNIKVSPTSFMLNRMQKTAQGNHDMQTMLARMQESDEGKLLARRMLQQYQYAKQNGMFDDLP